MKTFLLCVLRSVILTIAMIAPISSFSQTIQVGFLSSVPPYVFEDENRGLEYEIVVAAAKSAGLTVEPFYAPPERLFRMLGTSKLDAIATSNESYHLNASLSDEYITYDNVAIALSSRNLDITSIKSLGRYSVCSFQRAHEVLGDEFAYMANSSSLYHEEAQQFDRNLLLYSGRVDVVVGDIRIFAYLNHLVGTRVDTTQKVTIYRIFPPTHYKVAFLQQSLRDRFNQGLANIRASGELDTIKKRYKNLGINSETKQMRN